MNTLTLTKSMRATKLATATMLIVIACAAAWRAVHQPANHGAITLSGPTMGCMWSVKLPRGAGHLDRDTLSQEIVALLEELNRQMSNYDSGSELSRFNRSNSTKWFPVSESLAEVVELAQSVSRETNGAFDITVEPLVRLWGFGPRLEAPAAEPPSASEIASVGQKVNYQLLDVRRSPPALRKQRADVAIDLGAIGKGYAADRIGCLLETHHIGNYLVAVGGELRARGDGMTGRSWRVGIETPSPDTRRVHQTLLLDQRSLSTSGDYRNFRDVGGRRYCHEIDPRSGRPIEHSLASVSVLHPSGAYADAMATALLVLGAGEGYELACRLKLPCLFIERSDGRFITRSTLNFPINAKGDRHD